MATPNSTVRPALADVYFDWEAETLQSLPQSTGKIVAVAAPSDWGPENEVVELDSWDDYSPIYGESDTALRRAVYGAFKGQGVNGKGGAGQVLAYRQTGSSAALGGVSLMNTAGSPVNAIRLNGRYTGSRINDLRVTVQAGPTGGQDELVVLNGSLVIERYDYSATDIAALAAQINKLSDWFTATVLVDGVALNHSTRPVGTLGNDGSTLVSGDWTATFAAFDKERWSIFPAYNLTDPTIRASIVAWIQQRNALGNRCFGVFGGATGESYATAQARSAAINDFNIINLGEGTLHLTDQDRDCSTAEFVARYAGARAWRGETRDDIFVRFADVELVAGASLSEQQSAIADGVVVFSRDTNLAAPVFIREAVNTYTDDSQSPVDDNGNAMQPVELYRRIKNIAIQHGVELEVADWARSGDVLGELPVNEKTREQVLGRVRIAYSTRETAQVVQPGWTVISAPGQSDNDDAIFYWHGFHPTRSLRQIFNLARVG